MVAGLLLFYNFKSNGIRKAYLFFMLPLEIPTSVAESILPQLSNCGFNLAEKSWILEGMKERH